MKKQTSIVVLATFAMGLVLGFLGFSFVGSSQPARAESPEAIAKVQDLAGVFKDIGKKIEPSVVNIQVTKTIKNHPPVDMPFDDETLKKFFPDGRVPRRFQAPRDFQQQGTGSGVIVDVQGSTAFIVTNNHVAGDADKFVITLSDGREIKNGKLVGADPKSDIAVLKIEADKLVAANWGDSDQMDRGDWVLAFGSPLGFSGSMTHGIISALHRSNVGILNRDGFENFIQVDAPINPGNSGGPLINIKGEVIGINSAIATQSGGFQGIGFAIPSNYAKRIYSSLRESGKVTRGWMGVGMVGLTAPKTPERDYPALIEATGFKGDRGAYIDHVYPNTPANGKLEPGDVVTGIDGRDIADTNDLRNTIADTKPGTSVKLKVWRDGKYIDVAVTLAERPVDPEAPLAANGGNKIPEAALSTKLGIRLSDLSAELAEKYALGDAKAGAVITDVVEDSPAARVGLDEGDLITRVNRKPVSSAKQAMEEIEKIDLTQGVRLNYVNKDGAHLVVVKIDK